MSAVKIEIIVVRSLTESDLGLFAAHRAAAKSKQRALNINSDMARLMLSTRAFESGGADLKCICKYGDHEVREVRRFGKPGKNWRLGGKKLEGSLFADLDSKDISLIRTAANNDGEDPVTIIFVSKKQDRVLHAGLVAIVERHLDRSMAAFTNSDTQFPDLAKYCESSPWSFSSSPDLPPALARPLRPSQPPPPPMPKDEVPTSSGKPRTIRDKLRTPHLLEQMLKVAGDLSAPAQLRFLETVDRLASQLRELLIATNRIVTIKRGSRDLLA